jgi:hypothetical protein
MGHPTKPTLQVEWRNCGGIAVRSRGAFGRLLEDACFVGLFPGGLRPEFLLGFGQTISLCH